MLDFRPVRAYPVLFVVTTATMWAFFYSVIALLPYYMQGIRRPEIVSGCEEIRTGMNLPEALAAMHKKYQPRVEIFRVGHIEFYGEKSGCVVNLSMPDGRVKDVHTDTALTVLDIADQ